MEEDEHDADQAQDAPDQDIEPADRRATWKTYGCHQTIENGLTEGVIHEVEPDPCAFAIALDGNDCHGENIYVKSEAKSGERVEIVRGEHA